MKLITSIYPFDLGNIENIPAKEGVYQLLDSNQSTIYIGRTGNLYRRLQQHLNTDDSCILNARTFVFEVTLNSVTREKELLEEFRHKHGYLPRCNDRL